MLHFTCNTSVKAGGGGICRAQKGPHLIRTADYWVMILVRDKSLHTKIGDKEYEVLKDQVLFLPAGIEHRGTQPYPKGLVFYWLHFKVNESDIKQNLTLPLYTTLTRPHIMVELMRRYLDDQHSGRLEKMPLKGDIHLSQMLLEIAGNHRDTSTLPQAAVAKASRAEALIKSRFHLDLTATVLAEEIGCHPDHLGRVFKTVTGSTLTQAIQQRKIDKASQLLIESNLTVDQIGFEVGFNDRAYFRKIFKRLRKTTPSVYRSLHARANVNG